MYHPQCELLMPHEALDLTAGPSHLAVTAAPTAIPGELNFHFLHSLDTAAPAATASSQPTMDYFAGEPVQFEQLAPHHQMSMIREYYGHGHGHYSTESFPRSGSLVFGAAGAVDDAAGYVMGHFDSPSPQRAGGGKRRRRGGALGPPNGVEKKEKQRRQRLTEKFTALMLLIPNRTKEDRATVIADAIEYIRELGRTVEELTLLVDKKRRRRDIQGDVVDAPPAVAAAAGDAEGSEVEVAAATALAQRQPIRSTYIQRRSKETFVDVRIVEDEVNIKLTKRRRDGCLAAASRALDELRLDLIHVSGGKIGDCHIYMFNAKIHQGSSVFASAVASKLIEVVDEY